MDAKKLVLPGIAVAAWYYLSTKKAIGTLNYFIAGVGLGFDGMTPILSIKMGIQNPSNAQFTINSFVGNISANGQDVGTLSAFNPIVIPASSQVFYTLYVRMNLVGIVADIVNLLEQKSGIAQTINLKGYVNASGIVAPVDLNYKIAF